MPSLYVGSGTIDYSVRMGTSRRFTYFRFNPDLSLEIILPRGKSVDVEGLLRSRSAWLRHEYYRLANTKRILTRDSVILGGRPMKLLFKEGGNESLQVDEMTGTVLVEGRDRRTIREQVRRLFLKETSAYVVRKAAECAPLIGAKPSRVDVREMGKWGYCTRGGRLSFSWQLIALPDRLREYIVLHELAHLVHFDHSVSFRKLLASVCPDFRKRERELDLFAPYDRLGPPT